MGLILLIIVGSFFLNSFLENKIRETIAKELPQGFQINDYDIEVKSLRGSVSISELQLKLEHPSDSIKNSSVFLEKVSANGLGYLKYIFSDKLSFNSIKLNALEVIYYKDTLLPDSEEVTKESFDQWISTGEFSMENSSILFKDSEGSVFLAEDLNFYLDDVLVNKNTVKEKIPFEFSDLEVETSEMHYRVNEFDVLSLKDLKLLDNQLSLNNLTLQTVFDEDELPETKDHLDLDFPSITISDFYFETVDTTFQISGNAIQIDDASLKIKQGEKIQATEPGEESKKQNEIAIPFTMDSFNINNASVMITKADESTFLDVAELDFSLQEVTVNNSTLSQGIPLNFNDLRLETTSLQYRLNPYDMLTYKQLSLVDNSLEVTDLSIKTIYTRAELSAILDKERDHMDLVIPSLNLKEFYITSEDTILTAKGEAVTLTDPALTIYRDKLVADDKSIKPLYSKAIREIPFPLTLDSLFIKNASITYEERVKNDQPPGKIFFTELYAKVGNVSNTYEKGEKKTTLNIRSQFMDNSNLMIDWSFDVNDPDDRFHIQGELGSLNATRMNSFTKSHLRVGLEGNIKSTYFNINGNDDNSQIDFKINYDKLKVEILGEKDKKKWLPSAVANIFVSKSSDNKEGTFKDAKATAERKKDRSFFNYLWINIMEGLKEAVVNI